MGGGAKMNQLILHTDGREYMNEATYKEIAQYEESPPQFATALAKGLPHIIKTHDGKPHRYYNLQDCQRWHLGVDT